MLLTVAVLFYLQYSLTIFETNTGINNLNETMEGEYVSSSTKKFSFRFKNLHGQETIVFSVGTIAKSVKI